LHKQRFLAVLQRFYGFHAVWEEAIARHDALGRFHSARSRLPHLRRDLEALGCGSEQIDALPLCARAGALAAGEAAALGSLYVLEGSTLGGRVISRALSREPWFPQGGLAYFDPYGPHTGAMWLAFRRWCEEAGARHDREAVVIGAKRTFSLLQEWLVP
jgi:heme oxygenase